MFMSRLSHFCNISTSLNYFITRSGSVSMRILPYNTCSDEVWYKLFFCHSNAHWHGTAWFQVCSCWFVGFFNSVQLLPENGNVVCGREALMCLFACSLRRFWHLLWRKWMTKLCIALAPSLGKCGRVQTFFHLFAWLVRVVLFLFCTASTTPI